MFSWIKKRLTTPATPAAADAPASPATPPTTAAEQATPPLPVPAELLAEVLQKQGLAATRDGDWLSVQGLHIHIELINLDWFEERLHWRTQTEVRHPVFGEQPIREYQMGHLSGDGDFSGMSTRLDHWSQVDLSVLLEALRDVPEQLHYMNITLPPAPDAAADAPRQRYRVLFSPVEYLQELDAPPDDAEQHPPYCDCCLFTQSLQGVLPLLHKGGIVPLRLFATRNRDGETMADCRVNGEDYDPGQQALLRYAATWPPRGFEYRKQFVLAMPLAADASVAKAAVH